VLTATDTITHHTAASTASAIHLHYEGQVVETPISRFADNAGLGGIAVLAEAQGLVELFPEETQPMGSLVPVIDAAIGQGWRVGVIVPSDRIGEAHRDLRGQSIHLQAWWRDGEHIRFGGPEVP